MRKMAPLLLSAALTAALLVGPAGPASALPAWRTTKSSWTNPKATTPKVVDLRFARHRNYDRVVIDLKGRIPGGSAMYRSKFFYDPSGKRIKMRGGLLLILEPAYTYNAKGDPVYTGPTLARPKFPALKSLALAGSFEGQVAFAFGLKPLRAPYRIFRLYHPQRLVIDFKHPSS
jgi:hypothetical protein